MYRYSGFSLIIDSQLELPEFPMGSGEPDVTIRLGNIDRIPRPATIYDEVAFPQGVGGFLIMGGHQIVVDLLPHADMGVVRTLLAGRMMGYLLRQRGYLPLHASAVAIDGKAVLFIGESGSGKSTTAAAFYSRGHDVLADDVGAVRAAECGVELQAAWPGLRLLEASQTVIGADATPMNFQAEKHVYRLKGSPLTGPWPVKIIYFLDYEATGRLPVRSSAPSKFSAVALLNDNSLFRSWRAGHELRQINLDRSAAIASAVPVRRLSRSRSLDLLPELVNFVENDLRAR